MLFAICAAVALVYLVAAVAAYWRVKGSSTRGAIFVRTFVWQTAGFAAGFFVFAVVDLIR
jgi:hypothetical protein